MGSCQSSIPSYDDLSRFGGPSSICLQCGKPSRDRAVVRTHGQDHPDGIEGSGVAGDAGKPLPEFNRCREIASTGMSGLDRLNAGIVDQEHLESLLLRLCRWGEATASWLVAQWVCLALSTFTHLESKAVVWTSGVLGSYPQPRAPKVIFR